MTLEARLRPESEQDLVEASGWYEQQRLGLGHEFLDEFWAILGAIAERPASYPLVHRRTRRAVTHRFPFGVYYRIEDVGIVVVAVMHASRDPRRWKRRT